jgi:hypothetical protein
MEKNGFPIFLLARVARWFYFQTKKSQFGSISEGLRLEKMDTFSAIWNILRTSVLFYDHLVHFVFMWYIFSVLVRCNKKNLATLVSLLFPGIFLGKRCAKYCTIFPANFLVISFLLVSD